MKPGFYGFVLFLFFFFPTLFLLDHRSQEAQMSSYKGGIGNASVVVGVDVKYSVRAVSVLPAWGSL